MSKIEKEKETQEASQDQVEETAAPEEGEALPEEEIPEAAAFGEEAPGESGCNPFVEELEDVKKKLADQEDRFLRLAAEFDNFRKRSQKEKESIWLDAKAETVLALLPVYDNLERAIKQETCDEAYAKGVEMTMNGLREILTKLGVEEIPALGQSFDPNVHNAVMHVEDEGAEENTVVEVFQAGFRTGDKIIRFAMVKVAN